MTAAETTEVGALDTLKRLVSSRPDLGEVDPEAITWDATRDELGLGSLAVIMMIVDYIDAVAPGVVIRPEWVPRLNSVRDIIGVMAEVDQAGKAP